MEKGRAGAALLLSTAPLGVEMVMARDPGYYLALLGHAQSFHVRFVALHRVILLPLRQVLSAR